MLQRTGKGEARVLVDTCVWATFFNQRGTPTHTAVRRLVDQNRLVTNGVVIAEVLADNWPRDKASWVSSQLRRYPCLEIGWDDWVESARLARRLARFGVQLQLPDRIIATVAIRNRCLVFTTDPDFDRLPELGRYRPDN